LRPREIEVVRLVADGLTSKEIARRLRISPLTVRKHRENAMRRLGVHSMAELMRIARALLT
jgi:DNA-binding CsgD family transcriptional regulator